MKKTLYTELAYVLGVAGLAIGTAFTERAAFGMSMIVAPAYLLHLKWSEFFSWFSFGAAEYMVQICLVLAVALFHRKFKRRYLFSFATVIIYGAMLDASIWALNWFPYQSIPFRIVYYILGLVLVAGAVALIFHTYIPPGGYDLFVMELASILKMPNGRAKMLYDCSSLAVSVILSFAFFGWGNFVAINWGTFVCALVNGWIITQISNWLEKHFQFKDGIPSLKKFFG